MNNLSNYNDSDLADLFSEMADPNSDVYEIYNFPVANSKTGQILQYACVQLSHHELLEAKKIGLAEAKQLNIEDPEVISDYINMQLLFKSTKRVSDRTKSFFTTPHVIRSMKTQNIVEMLDNYDVMRIKSSKKIWNMTHEEMEKTIAQLAKGALDPENFLARMPSLMLMDYVMHLISHLTKLQTAYTSLGEQPDEPTKKILSKLSQTAPWLAEISAQQIPSTVSSTIEHETINQE